MKAILVENKKFVVSEVEKPSPKDNEILIKIEAAALNRADLLQKNGTYPSPEGWPQWPGLEVSGTVEDMGVQTQNSGNFQIGDKVCALLGGGGYAQYVCVPCGMVMQKGDLSNLYIIKFAEPLFACIFGAVILGENIFKLQYLIAFLLITGGIYYSNKKTSRTK